jgi:O-antigen/teichoic acid export membrane protein
MLRGASGTALLQAISNAGGLLTALLLARLLGSAGYGAYAFGFAWAGVLFIFATLGLDRYLVRGIAIYEVEGHWDLMKGLLRRSTQLVLASGIAIATIAGVMGVVLLPSFQKVPFCVAMALVPLTALTLLRQGGMQAFGQVVLGQIPEYLLRPVLIILGVLLLQFLGGATLTATTAMLVNVAAVAIAFITGAILFTRTVPGNLRQVQAMYATGEWIRAAIPMLVISGGWMLNNYVGTLVTGTLDGSSAAGVYSVVQSGAAIVVLFLVAANMPLAPVVARLHSRKDHEQLEHATERIAQAGLLASAPICLGLAAFPKVFLGLFGPGFESGATALTIVALCQLVNAASGPAGNALLMTGYQVAAGRVVVAAALVNLLLAIALVPTLGVTGAAISFGFSLVLWNLALVVIARRNLGVNVTAFSPLAMARR